MSQTLPVNAVGLNSSAATVGCGWGDDGDNCGNNDDDLLLAAKELPSISFCGSTQNCIVSAANRYPRITIQAQTTVDVTDLGDAVFYILDTFPWKGDEIPDNTCQYRFARAEDLVRTDFRLCCPFIGKYLCNGGVSGLYASEKILALWQSDPSVQKYSVSQFYGQIALYAMLTVFLNRPLTGKFDFDILYSKNYCDFIQKVGASRLCHFVDDYTNPSSPIVGFQKYFKKC